MQTKKLQDFPDGNIGEILDPRKDQGLRSWFFREGPERLLVSLSGERATVLSLREDGEGDSFLATEEVARKALDPEILVLVR